MYGACPNVKVTIGDVEMDQHFFVQESASHPVILGQPYITSSRMETKVFDNGAAFARIKSLDNQRSVQFEEQFLIFVVSLHRTLVVFGEMVDVD